MTSNAKNGWLVIAALSNINHIRVDGKFAGSHTDIEPTGWFWFKFSDGRRTQSYTRQTAPEWLLALYLEATELSRAASGR